MSSVGGRSLSPISGEIPGEKKFVEVNTQEQLIISTIGIYASKKGQDKYLPLQSPQQILFAPFEQLPRKHIDGETPTSKLIRPQVGNETPISGAGTSTFKGMSQTSTSPMQLLSNKNVSPSQFLASIN
jgi:hypothetical protein